MTRIQMRNAWFQAHKWIGLILAILIIPISLTGSALVWDHQVDALLHPARYHASGPAALSPATYVAHAEARLGPNMRVSRLMLSDDAPVQVQAVEAKQSRGRPARTTVYLSPASGAVVDVAKSGSGLLFVFHRLHGSLMVPGIGRQVVGWIGVAMLISCISGIWLWWPTAGSWIRGLRWRRHRNTDTNLHHLLGFWIALPLAVLSFTGAWISFPQFFGQFEAKQPQQQRAGPGRRELMRAKPLAAPVLTLDQALSRAASVAPGAVRSVNWPTDLQARWTVTTSGGQARVDDATGMARRDRARRGEGGSMNLSRWMRVIHDGHDMPLLWQCIVFLGGIIPAILAVTGIIMWWRARDWRTAQKRRRKRQTA
ncbi:putative iron-regulated membrane protein [Stakelama sediminis]|uniref:Putative iron-regulated membrane protein n=1 Tax=Stakelama sediminis TaxID=463200 RepID=A0A840YZ44_9SPHN|nr:PepSY-associated TM helix domain-containing protein [Stakelama sediminis]MBB5719071.1 putative iron-regulated membrane protein [Stakelama sediminis]